ncbi:MAG: hypothetical protein J6P64_00325 [Bacteroidales bacterium]|nr:hypothetical protein [Bacteroidales bacterium]
MKILVLRSSFQSDDFVRAEYAELLGLLKDNCNAEITIIGDENVETFQEMSLQNVDYVMVATGGVENLFKRIFEGRRFGKRLYKRQSPSLPTGATIHWQHRWKS